MPDFIPGLELSGRFYVECVAPLLDEHFPGLAHSAALIGPGSEVLGFDTALSTDHHWGPRVKLFLAEDDHARYAESIRNLLAAKLSASFLGWSTHFVKVPDEPVTMLLADPGGGPIQHRVDLLTAPRFFGEYLGFDPLRGVTLADWLTTPEQHLLTVTAGRVYHDGLGVLERARTLLAYYPDELWRYLLSVQWQRLSEEEPFMARCGDVGDEAGSRLLAARLIRDAMRLCFLMERRYAPYSKWFGTAFARLACAPVLLPLIDAALRATDWRSRETHLSAIYETLARMHNALGLTNPLPARVSAFHTRSYLVIHGDAFADALHATIQDEAVRRLPRGLGSLDQWVDSTAVLADPALYRKLVAMVG